MSEKILKEHIPCNECGSSDGKTIYEDGSSYCYVCEKYKKKDPEFDEACAGVPMQAETTCVQGVRITGKFRDIAERGLTQETCEKYGVRTIQKDGVIIKHRYPYFNRKGEISCIKTRLVETKQFAFEGLLGKDTGLFGQQLFPSAGKYITITEGELDAMAAFQMFGGKYPVVSISTGAAGASKVIMNNYEYLDGFENIVLCFDADKAGRENAEKVAQLLPPDKVKLVKLDETLKDADGYLMAGKTADFINSFWRMEEYRPEDVINIGDMFDRVMKYGDLHQFYPTPWQGVNEKIVGTRGGQLVIMAAGTGMGKSSFLKTWMKYLADTTEEHIGALYLEENPEDTVINLMSLCAGKNLKKPEIRDACSKEELKKYFEECGADRRIELFEPLKTTESEYITNKIRYLAVARKCKFIFLDHITYIADSADDVKKELGKLCHSLHDLCVSLNIVIIAACHLRKSANAAKTHEEGGRVSLDDLKDSSAIKQLADVIIGLERNSQELNEVSANTTAIRVLKNREFGEKGIACGAFYDKNTTRLTEVDTEALLEVDGDLL